MSKTKPLRIGKDQRGNMRAVGPVQGLGDRKLSDNPACPGEIKHLDDIYIGGPDHSVVLDKTMKKLFKEFEQLTGQRIKVPRMDEKWGGLLPDEPPVKKPSATDAHEGANQLIHDFNQKAGRLVVRRMFTKTGIALVVIQRGLYPTIRGSLRRYGLLQSGGPNEDQDGNLLLWVRHANSEVPEYEDPTFGVHAMEAMYRSVTSGKYVFESVQDLRSYLVTRALREGASDPAYLERVVNRLLRQSPPLRETFKNILVGSDEQIIVEGMKRHG